MSTIKEVAKLAGVSIGTVSNYLSGVKHVQPETAKKIKNAIDHLDYKPNAYAKNLRTNTNFEIGVILPNANEQYYSYLLAGIESELNKAGYYLNLAFSGDIPENELAVMDNFMKKNVRGLIIMSCLKGNAYYDQIKTTPIVFIDRKVTTQEANFVSFNQYETMTYLMAQLFSHNRKKIALFAGPEHFSCEQDYAAAFRDFMQSRGLKIEEGFIRHINMTKEEAFRTGISFFQDYSPDAIVSTSRILTSGLEQAAGLAGISLASDIAMISIGQETLSNFLKYNNVIVTMRPANTLGANAARLLLSNIDRPLLFEKQQIILNDKIIGKNLFEPAQNHTGPRSTGKNKLRLLFLDSPNANGIMRTHSAFTRQTGIDVDITVCEHGELLPKLMDKNYLKHFDVCMYDNPWLDILTSKNSFLDITDFIHSNVFDTSVFLEGLLEKVGLAGGRYYGVPFLFGPQLLLFRRDLFEDPKLGELFEKKYYEKLRVPRTWFEFNVVCSFFTRSLNTASPVEFGTSLSARNAAFLLPELMPRVWAYNGSVFDSRGIPLISSAEFKKGLGSLIEAFKYAPPQALAYSVENTVEDFYLGKTAMLVSFASFIADVNNSAKSKITGKIGYANIPGFHSVLGSWGLAIPSGCADPESAFAFIRWTCDPEMSSYFAILDGQSPLKNVYTNDELANHYPWLPLIYKTYSGNRQRKSIIRADGSLIPITIIEDLIYGHIVNVLQNNTSTEEAINALYSALSALD